MFFKILKKSFVTTNIWNLLLKQVGLWGESMDYSSANHGPTCNYTFLYYEVNLTELQERLRIVFHHQATKPTLSSLPIRPNKGTAAIYFMLFLFCNLLLHAAFINLRLLNTCSSSYLVDMNESCCISRSSFSILEKFSL